MFEGHPVKTLLERWGGELPGSRWFVVGGAVRDALLGRSVKDVDVLVANVPFDDVIAFLEARGSVDAVGRAFGVLKFVSREDGLRLDIALPRRERPAGTGGYRDVAAESDPTMPIEEDLARRDFTVNAMAWEAAKDCLVDPCGGQDDLGKRMLRAVGNPNLRFAEDFTRVLRMVRFAAQLNFEIEWETWKSAQAIVPRLNDEREGRRLLPYEMIARELLKGFEADPARTADLWQEIGLAAMLMPELKEWPKHVRNALERLAQPDMARILRGASAPMPVAYALSISYLGTEQALALGERLKLASADMGVNAVVVGRIAAGGEAAVYKELGLKPLLEGDEVMVLLGLAAGPEIGRALDLLLDAQAKGKVASSNEAKAFLKKAF